MKKVIVTYSKALGICLLLIATLSSCKKEEPRYSCNPELNSWAGKNASKFENYTRSQLVSIISLDTQGVIYATLPAESKYNIWKEKFQLAKDQLVTTDAEKAHLQTAIDYLKPEFWESNETLENVHPWMEAWGKKAMTDLGWDSTKLFIIAETWLMPNELESIADRYNNNPHVQYLPGSDGSGAKPACACIHNISCQWFREKCDGDCDKVVYKCGISGSAKCTGICVSNTSADSPVDPQNHDPKNQTQQKYNVH